MGKLLFNMLTFLILIAMGCKDGKTMEDKNSLTMTDAAVKSLKESTENYLNAWSQNDTVLLQEVSIKKMVRNVNGKIVSVNQNELFKIIQFWHRALPDFKMVEKEIVVVGDRTFVNWIGTGTNTGMFGDIPPTGKKIQTEGFSVLTFDDAGLIVHEAAFYDLLGLMTEWGYTVSPPVME